jgi:CTD kinase subunit beta
MAPAGSPTEPPFTRNSAGERIGPHASYIEVAKPYILESRIRKCLADLSMTDTKEDAARLQGVTYIDQVRRALQLPIRTFNTAAVYYHKFRLIHPENEYDFAQAGAAALFTACKIEDTLKKSREILAAYWNLKVDVGEQLSSDDPVGLVLSTLVVNMVLTLGCRASTPSLFWPWSARCLNPRASTLGIDTRRKSW